MQFARVEGEHPHDSPAGSIADAVEGVRGYGNDVAIQRAEAGTLAEVEQIRAETIRTNGGAFPESDQWVWRVFRFRDMPATRQTGLLDAFVTRPIPVAPGTPASQVPEPSLMFPGGRRFDWTDLRGPHQTFRVPRCLDDAMQGIASVPAPTRRLLCRCCGVPRKPSKRRANRVPPSCDSIGVASDECEAGDERPLVYRYPAGTEVKIRASKDPVWTVVLDESVSIRLLDFSGSKTPGMRAVVADVIPPIAVLQQAAEVRRSLQRCDLLIVLNSEAVGIERRGRAWDQRLPGGVFVSREAAERAFARSDASVRHEVPPESELNAEDDFWEWRRQKDLWDFHCDSTLQETIRAKDPKLYETLMQTPAPDCQSPPVMPEPGPSD